MNKNLVTEKNSEFIGADLHVHTPASKCYEGDKNDIEYIQIIRKFYSKGIRIIAITDHNTIKGYKELIRIKQSLINKLEVLGEYVKKHKELEAEYKKIKADIDIFDSMLIIPGVEYEAKPGIHILLLFSPDTDLGKIDKFLIASGYSEDTQGEENPDMISNLDVLDVLSKSASLNAIAIGAHVDSNKGIYNKLDGSYRANIFRSNQLVAISYNSPKTCSKIKSMLMNREYKRDRPLAYIQCSDYHGGEEKVGACITYFKLDKLDYESFLAAFNNPNECISLTANPETIQIIEKTVNDPTTRTYENLGNEEDMEEIRKTVCAILNYGYGSMVFGVSVKDEFNIIGVQKDEKECLEIIETILKPITETHYRLAEFNVMIYPFNNKRLVIILNLNSKAKRLFYLNNEVYIFENDIVVKASPKEIESLVENNLLSKMDNYQQINQKSYDDIIKELTLLKDGTKRFLIINRIDKDALKLPDIVELELCNKYIGDFVPGHTNGKGEGNVYFSGRFEPRLPCSYLRYSCPRTDGYDPNQLSVKTHYGNAIIIVPGGGCFLIDANEWKLICLSNEPLLIIKMREFVKDILSPFALVGWLKSSLLLWYNYATSHNINIHNANTFRNTPIPNLKMLNKGSIVESLVIELCKKEYAFLTELHTTYPKIDAPSELTEDEIASAESLIEKHNEESAEIAYKIDNAFFVELKITSDEEEMVKKFFTTKNIFNIIR